MSSNRFGFLARITLLSALFAAIWTITSTLVIVKRSYFPLPFEDSWSFWQRYLYYGNYAAFVFEQHNEHRIAVSRLLFILDRFLLGGRNVFPLIVSLLCQVGAAVGIYKLIARTARFEFYWRFLLAALVACALFSAQQFDNLVLPFQVQFSALYSFFCASLLALLRTTEKELNSVQEWPFILAGLCAIVVTYSSFNGIACWAVLMGLGLWVRLPRLYILALAIDTCLAAAVYFSGYQTPAVHRTSPAQTGLRMAVFLGAPFDGTGNMLSRLLGVSLDDARIGVAGALGGIGLEWFFWNGVLLFRHRDRYTKFHAALFGLSSFVVISAAMVAIGRAGFPIEQTLQSRYITHGIMFWLSLFGFSCSQFIKQDRNLPPRRQAVLASAIAGLTLLIGFRQTYWLRHSEEFASILRDVQSAIIANVYDEPLWRISYPPSGLMIVESVEYLRRNRLSVFNEPWTRWTGEKLEDLFHISPQTCVGSFESMTAIPDTRMPGWLISGWAWDKYRKSGPQFILVVDSGGQIVATVNDITERPDVRSVLHEVNSSRVGWRGYVGGSVLPHPTAYLLDLGALSVCPFGAR